MTDDCGKHRWVLLAGAIDLDPDHGKEWRLRIAQTLRDIGLDTYDPVAMQKRVCGYDVADLLQLRTEDEERFHEVTRLLIRRDLQLVSTSCLAVIGRVNRYVRMGTYAELAIAFLNDVPIHLIIDDPRDQVSGWALSVADNVFESESALVSCLTGRFQRGLRSSDLFRRDGA